MVIIINARNTLFTYKNGKLAQNPNGNFTYCGTNYTFIVLFDWCHKPQGHDPFICTTCYDIPEYFFVTTHFRFGLIQNVML